MGNQGWIKLYRQLQECSIWVNEKPFDDRSAWIDLLLLANHSDKEILFNRKRVVIKRGQYLTSVRKLSERWIWSKDKTLRYLRMLEELEMLIKESDNNRTLLTIVNYEIYQGLCDTDKDTYKDSSKDSNKYTDKDTDKPQTRIKELKNVKNDKNEKNIREIFYHDDEELNNAFAEYVGMRKKIKKPFTSDHAVQLAINKLDKLSRGNRQMAIDIINESIEHSWVGLFELKQDKTSSYRRERNLLDELNNCV